MSALFGIADLRQGSSTDLSTALSRMAAVLGHRGAALKTVTAETCAIAVKRRDPVAASAAVGRSEIGLICGVDGVLFDAAQGAEARFVLDRYARDGVGVADELDGEFAVACFDARSRKLLLARDPFGVRPLFYTIHDGVCYFASEVKSILEVLPVAPDVNEAAVNDVLSFGYVPHPETMFAGVYTVRPGSAIEVGDGVREHVYWRYGFGEDAAAFSAEAATSSGRRDERGRRFMELLASAVEKRTRGGSRLGSYLSGGVDSTAVCVMLSRQAEVDAPAISIGFDEEAFDELPDAEEAARYLGLRHYTERVHASDATPQLLEELVRMYDAPFEDTSAIPTGAAARLAAKHVDVVLTGDGPDQLLGGSRRHLVALRQARSRRPLDTVLRRSGFRHAVRRLPVTAATDGLASRITRRLYRDSLTIMERTSEPRITPLLVQRELYSAGFQRMTRNRPPWRNILPVMQRACDKHPLEQCLHYDVHFYLQDCLIPKVERACSAQGLECRLPFLDRTLTAFVSGLPLADRIDGNSQKDILRRSLRPALPEGFLDRGKRGFAVPRDEWLSGSLKEFVLDTLTSRKSLERGYFSARGLKALLERYYGRGVRYYGASGGLLVALVTLELWHRSFIDRE